MKNYILSLFIALSFTAKTFAVASTASPISPPVPTPTPPVAAAQVESVSSQGEAPQPTPTPPPSNGSAALQSAQVAISSQLDLVTTTLWSGSLEIWNTAKPGANPGTPDKPGTPDTGTPNRDILDWNVSVSSTLPASKPDSGSSDKYQDSENLFPTGGVLNILISPWATVKAANYNPSKNGVALYGRGASADRLYWSNDDLFTTYALKGYWLDGFGGKLINRNVNTATSTTASNDVSNYGVAGTGYLGIGGDGGLVPLDQSSTSNFGNIRLEGYLEANYADGVSISAMYPNAPGAKHYSVGVGGDFSFVIGSIVSISVQGALPLGSSRSYMGKVILVGITFNAPKSKQ